MHSKQYFSFTCIVWLFVSSGNGLGADLWAVPEFLLRPIEALHRKRPPTDTDDAIERLASEIDWLEHHIDANGTIVAQHPAVWGESRLMRHRDEYERIMARQLDQFQVKMNATLRRSDQSFLASATALSFAISGSQATQTGPPTTPEGTPTVSALTPPEVRVDVTNALLPDLQSQSAVFDSETGELTVSEGTSNNVNLFRTPPSGISGRFPDSANLSLEPTLDLDQRSRFLNHLHELRRINEGDDTSDSPGYSLNLLRIPVSVLTGRKTRKGYGAEITVTATPHLSRELLPTTFRSLVINDLVDHLAYPITRVINSDDRVVASILNDLAVVHFHEETKFPRDSGVAQASSHDENVCREACGRLQESMFGSAILPNATEFFSEVTTFALPVAPTRRARLPFPPTQLLSVYDIGLLAHIAADARSGLGAHAASGERLHLMDVQGFLQQELQAAYEFLSIPEHSSLWEQFCPSIAAVLHSRSVDGLVELRKEYMRFVGINFDVPTEYWRTGNTTKALAWMILVESSLLNERLNEDVAEASQERGCHSEFAGWLPFHGPQPPEEARVAFNDYVNCRWPIQVFALDPVTQDQNVADVYSRRRELQMALALGFVSGRINGQNLTRFSRRLETDIETISLNRTAVGFSHGNDTFGWRFQPRMQTPPDPGNLRVLGQTLFGGPSRDSDIKQRELEAGIRECTAIVVMPSFVPYLKIDTRTNWFKLTDPKHTEISMRKTMDLSRAVTAMRSSAALCSECAHLYRPGEVERMLRRVQQLDRELPLQTMTVQIPYENTAGGFELFSSGVTDLGPELVGWYGAPGINAGGTTSLFLVGDGFSVHDTKVIAGGRPVAFNLISRQLMRAEIPAGVQVLTDDKNDLVVDVHLASPYGVTGHLLVPVAQPGSQLAGGNSDYTWRPANYEVYFTSGPDGKVTVQQFTLEHSELVIDAPAAANPPGTVSLEVTVRTESGDYIAGFSQSEVRLDPRANQYFLAGATVATFNASVASVFEAYWKSLGEQHWNNSPGEALSLSARLRGPNGRSIAVVNDLGIRFTKR